jgi:hypothetical protein
VVTTPQDKLSDSGDKAVHKPDSGEVAGQDLGITAAMFVVVFCSPIQGQFFPDVLVDGAVDCSMLMEKLDELLVNIWRPFFIGGKIGFYWLGSALSYQQVSSHDQEQSLREPASLFVQLLFVVIVNWFGTFSWEEVSIRFDSILPGSMCSPKVSKRSLICISLDARGRGL